MTVIRFLQHGMQGDYQPEPSPDRLDPATAQADQGLRDLSDLLDGGRLSRRRPERGSEGSRHGKPGLQATRRLGCGLMLTGLLILFLGTAWTGLQLLSRARSLQSHLRSLEHLATGDAGELSAEALRGAGQSLAEMRDDLAAIEAQVGPLLPLGRFLTWVPAFGGDLAAAADLLEVASAVATAGDRTFEALSPALESEGSGWAAVEQFVPLLVTARPELEAARQELAAAARARAELDTSRLSSRMGGWAERLDRLLPSFATGLDSALLAPDLLGSGAYRTYLIVAQNNDELRATGGFISGVGVLRIENGRITTLVFSDSYAVDNLEAPHDLTPLAFQQTLAGELWFFRDANWDADFPTSARRALEIYARDRGVEADGVVALDLIALRLLVEAVGPLQVEGLDGPVTAENVVQVLQAQWANPSAGPALEAGGGLEWWPHRKDFMGEVASAALARIVAGEGVDAGRLVQAMKRALDEKHLLVYLVNPEASALLRHQNWDGSLPDPSARGDLLLVVDSNVGFNKADARVARAIGYRVDLGGDGGPEAEVAITYRHGVRRPAAACLQEARYGDSYADMTERCYWDYLRVYVPAGSALLANPALAIPPGSLLARSAAGTSGTVSPTLTENGLDVWAAFFDLEAGRERTLRFTYRLPPSVLDPESGGLVRYRLRVQKQPGTEAIPFQLELVLPPGAMVVDATPHDLRTSQRLSTDLRTDRDFEIVYRTTGNP